MKKKPLIDKNGEVREISQDEMHHFRSASEVLPPHAFNNLPKRHRGQRGAQKRPTKQSVTIRYSSEVIEYFKSTGKGWQKRMDEALKEWITIHTHAA